MTETCRSNLLPDALTKDTWARVERHTRNKLWVMNNIKTLRLQYPDMYVAYDNGKVLASADSSDELFRLLRRRKKADLSVVAVEFVSKEPVIWLL